MHQVRLSCGATVPAIGQGTWYIGEAGADHAAEVRALRLGLDLGLSLIDTAEMYADGGSEKVVGQAIAGRRDEVFLVSKLYPQNASHASAIAACERSLRRLGTDRLDLYLLHWRGSVPLAETVAAFEALRRAGKILRWGVSNLDSDDMKSLLRIDGGTACATDQVLYNPATRGIEFDLLPLCGESGIAVMAYSPLDQAGTLLRNGALTEIATRHGVSTAQVALAWAIRHPHVIVIPKATNPDHVRANVAAAGLRLTEEDFGEIDLVFPPPRTVQPLAML